jgi:hypothetical protein
LPTSKGKETQYWRERREREMSLDLLVLEMLVEELVDGQAAEVDAQKLRFLLHAPRHQRLGDVVHGDRRRIHESQQNEIQIALGLLVEPTKRVGILGGEARNRRAGLVEVGVDGERGPVAEHRTHLDRWVDVAQSVLLELQVLVDRADPHERVVVAVDIVQEPRLRKLLGAEATPLLTPLLEDGYLPAAPGQVRAEGHAVVAGSDDDRIVGRVGHGLLLLNRRIAAGPR